MRSSYLVSYDIADEMRERLKLKRDSGELFEYRFRPSDLVRCRKALRGAIHHGDDEFLFVEPGLSDGEPRSGRSALALNLLDPFEPLIPEFFGPFPNEFTGVPLKTLDHFGHRASELVFPG